jgi:2,4-dienoyl-CoA reductase-like NADH-dependent reductase (Old Yellow Enzyme family)
VVREELSILFEPLTVKGLTLRNRIVCPPMATNRGITTPDGIEWYRRIARGGAGMVIVEATQISRFGEDIKLDGLKKLAEAIKSEGAVSAIQLFMSPVDGRNEPNSLTKQDIKLSIYRFRNAARMCKEAGFDGVEPHGAHGFLLNKFFSPKANRRNDEYGGNLKNRMRLALEIVSAIREEVGDDMLLLYRHTPVEKDGYTIEESIEFCSNLVESGVDVLDISPASEARPADLAEPFKRSINVPVIAVGMMGIHERAIEALREGRADLIAIGRALIADPDWPIKTMQGNIEGIIKCRYCNEGCFGNLRSGKPVECVQHRQPN